MSHVVVVGAGIAGISTAYALVRRGHSVSVVDQNLYPAMETSFANGGQISASNAEVWNSVASVLKGLRWMWRADAPLLLSLKPSWHKYSWLAAFIAQIPRYGENTVQTVRLALLARQAMADWAQEEGIAFDHVRRGILHVYRDQAGFSHAERVNLLLAEGGLQRRPVTAEEIRTIEPALEGRFYGGFYTETDSTGDIHKFTRGLAEACGRRGARFVWGRAVSSVSANGREVVVRLKPGDGAETGESLRADRIVVCAGARSRGLARQLGDSLNVYPVKGYSITVPLATQESRAAAPWTSLLDDEAKIVTSRLGDDRLRVAGTAEINGYNRDIRADRIEPLVRWTNRHFPGVELSQAVPWAGLRPMMPSMLPRVGRGRIGNVHYNTGHGHLGWTLACATAEIVADDIDRASSA